MNLSNLPQAAIDPTTLPGGCTASHQSYKFKRGLHPRPSPSGLRCPQGIRNFLPAFNPPNPQVFTYHLDQDVLARDKWERGSKSIFKIARKSRLPSSPLHQPETIFKTSFGPKIPKPLAVTPLYELLDSVLEHERPRHLGDVRLPMLSSITPHF
ncbi:hypothetical protein D5086_023663 [Populus alba]|uniref:Uncharacterized protein n=2 Tax=Populus alba TaxID=43335 RepID=A0ACC4BAG3_POPAL|nr:hypothetical protein D5086_0000306770 [Populus alba]